MHRMFQYSSTPFRECSGEPTLCCPPPFERAIRKCFWPFPEDGKVIPNKPISVSPPFLTWRHPLTFSPVSSCPYPIHEILRTLSVALHPCFPKGGWACPGARGLLVSRLVSDGRGGNIYLSSRAEEVAARRFVCASAASIGRAW